MQLIDCPACGSWRTGPDPFFYVWRNRRFEIYRCGVCTHQFVYPPVTPLDQRAIYSDQYFAEGGDWACGHYHSASYEKAEPELRSEARSVLAMLPLAQGALLDIGCAGGIFLDTARAAGFDQVAGIELNVTMAAQARARFGLEVVNARIEDVPAERWSQAFDVVTLMDCLEHIPHPLELLRKVARWIRPHGVLLIRGPLADSQVVRMKEALRRAFRVVKQLRRYPLDANTFNPLSLDAMLGRTGFSIERWVGRTGSFANLLARRTLHSIL